ncbi:uncharacterized protein TRIADDRAFT_56038 [Trichoplax adhaerens]|uniref:Phospholipid scramblase n=1 Tax=Trichoplax adhaerens TaxID=10228 RepID=B3RTT3_TRIAD|nr:hypothetical protein TRIADDRAFT_56038 [Trichoplax adhaerens]EDV26192.1 hypothetical protein TRIADDRAFT_56038 [Trichoplax adhaerens]|eukprot:XP_002112225.1 hypothetical protein TRIADDRAFT_56038 [Trichoplax adhaerens]
MEAPSEDTKGPVPTDNDNYNPPPPPLPITQQPLGYNPVNPPYPANPSMANPPYNPANPPYPANPSMANPPLMMNNPAPLQMNQVTLHQPGTAAYRATEVPNLALMGLQQQQQQMQWMMPPPPSPSCPPGLECLTQLDQIIIMQRLNIVELMRGIDMANRYDAKNKFGQEVFFLAEVPTPFSCNCCSRLFHMKILDANDKEVMHYSRPYRCGLCCCCCCFTDCMEDMTIESPTGNAIGSIRQTARIGPKFQVLDTEKNKIFNVNGPFGVVDTDGQNVGSIVKGWSGMRSVVSQDRLDINSVPMDLDVKNKALMMGAGILIDYMLFQRVMANNNRR